jgi:hypothetical protein
MEHRVDQELALLRERYPDLEYFPQGRWVVIPNYPLSEGWNRSATSVAFQIPVAHPGTPPYGFYVPAGLLFGGQRPQNYTEPSSSQPLPGGSWGIFSWSPIGGEWRPAVDVRKGSNLLRWAASFAMRFGEGRNVQTVLNLDASLYSELRAHLFPAESQSEEVAFLYVESSC